PATWFSQAMAKGPLEKVSADIDLYGGLAGIGWFLSEFAAGSGSQPARSTAIAGLEQAFFLLDSKATAVGGGLYDGRIGLALAAVRCGQLLKCPSLLDRGRALILDQSRVPNDEDEANSDVISGDAGKLLGLLASETLPMA